VAVKGRGGTSFLATADAAVERLASAPLPPLIVIAGEQPFVKERLIDTAARAAESAGGSVETFAARPGESEPAAAERLLDSWATPTLFGGSRLIVARGADGMLAGARGQRLLAQLEAGEPPHRLLLTVDALDGRSKLARRLKDSDALIALPPLRDTPPPWHRGGPFLETDLNLWIAAEGRRLGLRVELAVADELAQRIGNEPAALARKLEQLGVLVGTARPLSLEDVHRHVRRSSARLLALYEHALRAGDASRALEHLDRMLAEGVYDHTERLVSGDEAADTVLRGLTGNLARVLEVHERLTPELRAALASRPWERSEADSAALAEVLGGGGRRFFLERDLQAIRLEAARAGLMLALAGLRSLRDGAGLSLHALTVRLARTLAAGGRAAARRAPAAPTAPAGRNRAGRAEGGSAPW
jgi:DNA polymerase III delta subunit